MPTVGVTALNDTSFLPQPNNVETRPEQNSDVSHDMKYEHDEELADMVAREVRRALRDHTPMQANGRSVDTLRRDIGILAILLAMGAQTGMAFYWAGGISRTNEATQKEIEKVSSEQAYQRAQLQLLDGQLKEMKGKQDERDKSGRR